MLYPSIVIDNIWVTGCLDDFEDSREVARALAAQAPAGVDEAVPEQILS